MAPFEFSLGFLPSRMQSGGALRLLPHSKSSEKLIDDWKDECIRNRDADIQAVARPQSQQGEVFPLRTTDKWWPYLGLKQPLPLRP